MFILLYYFDDDSMGFFGSAGIQLLAVVAGTDASDAKLLHARTATKGISRAPWFLTIEGGHKELVASEKCTLLYLYTVARDDDLLQPDPEESIGFNKLNRLGNH